MLNQCETCSKVGFQGSGSAKVGRLSLTYHGVAAVGGRSSALADDFFEASLVDRCIAFWATHANQNIRDLLEGKCDFKYRWFETLTPALVSLLVESPKKKK